MTQGDSLCKPLVSLALRMKLWRRVLIEEDWIGSGSTVIKSLTWTYDADGRVATAGDDGSSYTMSYNSGGYLSQVLSNIGRGRDRPCGRPGL
jgi:YD repeat-containing protein